VAVVGVKLRCALRPLREAQGLSLREMSERTGINHGTLSQLEKGRLLPSDPQLPTLEGAYGEPVEAWYSARVLVELQDDGDDA
jgi:transcriptional regulator with XRE-family HTH domain